MRQRYHLLIACVAVPAILGGTPGVAADKDAQSCLKPLSILGFPHRLKLVAELNAVSAWSIQSEKLGADYGMWHNARGTQVSCAQFTNSLYYRCTATARPCLARKVPAQE